MKLKTVVAASAALASIFAAAPFAGAQTPGIAVRDSGPYLGGGIGRSQIRFENGSFAANTPLVGESRDRHDTAWSAFAGYNFDRRWGVEGGYTDFGNFNYNYTGAGALAGSVGRADYQARSWWLAGKGTFPINDKFEVFGKLGLAANRAEVNGSANSAGLNAVLGTPFDRDRTHAGLLAGLGAEYRLNRQMGIRLEYDDYGKFGSGGSRNEARLNLWQAGLTYRF